MSDLNAENVQLGRSVNWVSIELDPRMSGSDLLEMLGDNKSFWNGQITVQGDAGQAALVATAVKNINLGFFNDGEDPMSLMHHTNMFRTPQLAHEYAERFFDWITQQFNIVDLTVFSLPKPREAQTPLDHTPARTAQVIIPTLADLFVFKDERSDKPFRSVSQL